MSASIHQLHPQNSPLIGFLQVGREGIVNSNISSLLESFRFGELYSTLRELDSAIRSAQFAVKLKVPDEKMEKTSLLQR